MLGNFVTQPQGYKAFIPDRFPPKNELVFGSKVHLMNAEATLALGKLDGVAQLIPDISFFTLMFVKKRYSQVISKVQKLL